MKVMFIHHKLENLNSAVKGILHRTTLFHVSDIDVTLKINHGPQNWSKSVKLSGEHKKDWKISLKQFLRQTQLMKFLQSWEHSHMPLKPLCATENKATHTHTHTHTQQQQQQHIVSWP